MNVWRDNPGVEVWLPLFSYDIQLALPGNTVFLDAQIPFQRTKKYKRMIILVWNCGRSVASCPAPPLIICCSNSHVSAQTTNDWKDIPVSLTLNFSLCSSQVACFDTYMQKKSFWKDSVLFWKFDWPLVKPAWLWYSFLEVRNRKETEGDPSCHIKFSSSYSTLDLKSYQRNFSPSKPKPFVAHPKR